MVLINKQNGQLLDPISRSPDLVPLILTTGILKHCKDYETLKRIQLTSSTLNDLFNSNNQSVWQQLCRRNRYTRILKKEAICFLKGKQSIWERIYYQNWQVELNWYNKNYQITRLGNQENRLVKMINGGTVLGLSFLINTKCSDVIVNIIDLKNGGSVIRSQRQSGIITSSCLHNGILILGKDNGAMTTYNFRENSETTMKFHSKEITSIVVFREFIVSGDIGGQIIKSKQNNPIVLYQNESGITGLHQNGNEIFASTVSGVLIIIYIKDDDNGKCFIEKIPFNRVGSINCITCVEKFVVLGTDSGQLIIIKPNAIYSVKVFKNSPIISIAADSKRVITGHFDGTISIYTIKTGLIHEEQYGNRPIWSVGIDEISFISSSLKGEIVLRSLL